MPIVIGLFCLLPLAVGLVAEYLCCRLPKGRWQRAVPPAVVVLAAAGIGAGRLGLWTSESASPLTQLLLFPGLPCGCAMVGCWLGWRLWKRLWGPKILDHP